MDTTDRQPTNFRTILCACIFAIGTGPMVWASHGWATAPRDPSGQAVFGPGLICVIAWFLMAAVYLPCTGFLLYSAWKGQVRNRTAAHGLSAAAAILLSLPVLYALTMPR